MIIEPSIKEQIHILVRDYCQKYPDFVSDSSRCQRPNFNRDTFDSDLYDLYVIYDLTIDELKSCLKLLNKRYSLDKKGYTERISKKCFKYGFYLFVYPRIQSVHFQEELLKLRNK
jgi:hypothetical protein